jgi:tripartite-type tricarboxylate transporter receptor subunit TctC
MKRMSIGGLAAAVALTVSAILPAAAQQSVADFYRGKTVEFIIGYPPGAGFDIFGRTFAQHVGKHIPGTPTVVAKNMPGASSLKGLQYIAMQAPKDGTTMGLFNPAIVNMSVLDPKQVGVDLDKLTWLGNMSNDTKVCFSWSATGIQTFDDIRQKSIVIGGTSQGAGFIYGSILKQMLGDKLKVVLGYPSNSDVWLALERGEVQGNCTGWGIIPSVKPDWVRDKKVNVFVQFAQESHPDLKGVPLIFDLGLSPEMKAAVNFLTLSDSFTRPVVAPGGIPADRAEALQKAFDATMQDRDFLAQAEKSKLEIAPMNAKALMELVRQVRSTPAAAVELAKELSK